MKYCCGIADGSNHHQVSWRYKMLNISLYANGKTHILSQHLYSSNAKNYQSDWTEQQSKKREIKQIMPTKNNIIIEDSIEDDTKRINFYSEEMEVWKIFFWYKKRWEVEKIYRDIKQKFKLESALIRDYKFGKH